MNGRLPWSERRRRMVANQIACRGIRDPAVLRAMETVPRELFVPDTLVEEADGDCALPIGLSQTISQPYIVALMAEALRLQPTDRVLEVGTGSGYAAAVLSKLVAEVYSVERIPTLADSAAERLARLGFDNVRVRRADDVLGWPEQAPFDAISVPCAADDVPVALVEQLGDGGRLVIPVGDLFGQVLKLVERLPDGSCSERKLSRVAFVPLRTD